MLNQKLLKGTIKAVYKNNLVKSWRILLTNSLTTLLFQQSKIMRRQAGRKTLRSRLIAQIIG